MPFGRILSPVCRPPSMAGPWASFVGVLLVGLVVIAFVSLW
jgi:hypothetical protein